MPGHAVATARDHLFLALLKKAILTLCVLCRSRPPTLLSHRLPGGFEVPLTVRPDRGAPAENLD